MWFPKKHLFRLLLNVLCGLCHRSCSSPYLVPDSCVITPFMRLLDSIYVAQWSVMWTTVCSLETAFFSQFQLDAIIPLLPLQSVAQLLKCTGKLQPILSILVIKSHYTNYFRGYILGHIRFFFARNAGSWCGLITPEVCLFGWPASGPAFWHRISHCACSGDSSL